MQNHNIPKKIHYCRFGPLPKHESFLAYLASREKHCPDYEIIERNETNFDISNNPYIKNAYEKQSRAFVADYARFAILHQEWWIYLDTDVELLQPLDRFLQDEFFTGMENNTEVWGCIMGSIPQHRFTAQVLEFYQSRNTRIVLPKLLTTLVKKNWFSIEDKKQCINGMHIYPKHTFYPFAYYENFHPTQIKPDTFAIHWFNASRLPWWFVKFTFPIVWLWKKVF